MLTDERGVRKKALQRSLIFRSVEERMNGVEDFRVENTPDTDRVAIVLMAEPIQEPIDGFGFRLKPLESLAINPTQICLLHAFLRSTIF